MKEYWEVFENEPMAQGGCIWDWVDQSFREVDKDGKWYWTYGGDYGPKDVPSFWKLLLQWVGKCCPGTSSAFAGSKEDLSEYKEHTD